MTKSISLKDVAKRAGVGLGTASRVLNNNSSVKEETRKLVMKAMEELDYHPDSIARSLKMKSTRTVGVMIPDISSQFFPGIVRGIEDVANSLRYNIILCNTDLDAEKERSVLTILKQKKVDGILFISNTIGAELAGQFKGLGIPIVLLSTRDFMNEFPSVNIDNERAAYAAVDYLCKLGHRNIAMIAGGFNDPNAGIPRIEGYKRALKDNGIEYNEGLVYEGDFGYKAGYENAAIILKRKLRPTAIFAASDVMAIGASKALLEAGLRIPDDISIFGFDGIEAAEFFYPSISTIEQPRYDIGASGMKLLIKLMNKEEVDQTNIYLDYKLINRESCKSIGGK